MSADNMMQVWPAYSIGTWQLCYELLW